MLETYIISIPSYYVLHNKNGKKKIIYLWLTVYFTFWSSSMVAGTVSTLITAPMDMIKTRLMLQRESKEVGNYKNGFHCAYQVFEFVFIFILHWFFFIHFFLKCVGDCYCWQFCNFEKGIFMKFPWIRSPWDACNVPKKEKS